MDLYSSLALASAVVMFLIGTPLAVAFSLSSVIVLIYVMDFPLGNVAQLFFLSINGYALLAMPFFILAGNIILRCDGMRHLRDFMNGMLGGIHGGMAAALVVFAAFLGSISGSATACLAVIGTVFVPMLVDSGYSRAYVSGLTVVNAGLGAVIPPSVFLILFGAGNRVSIADLFIGGIGPGLLAAFLMICYVLYSSKKRGFRSTVAMAPAEKKRAFLKSLPIICMPFIVLGGIYSGVFSPTQAASVAVFYSLIISLCCYRGFTARHLMEALVETTRLSSMIYFLCVGGELFGKVIGYIGVPQMITEWVVGFDLGPVTFLLAAQALLLGMGFFFSSFPMVIIVLPLFMPSVHALGIDPVLYGVLAIFCSIIGEVTPPMGPQLWVAAPICKEKIGSIMREAWAPLGVQVLSLVIVTLCPQICLFLVELAR